MVYIAEAHSIDGWQTDSNEEEGIRWRRHRTMAERRHAAERCAQALDLSVPILIDEMDDAAAEAFAAWPERIFILRDSVVGYCGGPGPYEFDPSEARDALAAMIAPSSSQPSWSPAFPE